MWQKRPQWEIRTNSTASPEKVAWSPQSTTAITPYYQSTVAPPIVESPNTRAIKAKRTDLVFNSPTAHFHVVTPSKRQVGTAAYGKGYNSEHFGHHREIFSGGQWQDGTVQWPYHNNGGQQDMANQWPQGTPNYDDSKDISYSKNRGSRKARSTTRNAQPKTTIVYDIYDADTPIVAPQQQVWYPLGYFYRSAE